MLRTWCGWGTACLLAGSLPSVAVAAEVHGTCVYVRNQRERRRYRLLGSYLHASMHARAHLCTMGGWSLHIQAHSQASLAC